MLCLKKLVLLLLIDKNSNNDCSFGRCTPLHPPFFDRKPSKSHLQASQALKAFRTNIIGTLIVNGR